MTRHRSLLAMAALLGACDSQGLPSAGDMSAGRVLRSTIPCSSSSDCPADLPTCDPQAQVCTGCISAVPSCPAGQVCDDLTRTCRPRGPNTPECSSNADCPPIGEASRRSICRTGAGQCVECLVDGDCGSPTPLCDNGADQGDGGSIADAGAPTYRCVALQ